MGARKKAITRREFARQAGGAAALLGALGSAGPVKSAPPAPARRSRSLRFGMDGDWFVSFSPLIEEGKGRHTRVNLLNPIYNYLDPGGEGQEKEAFLRLYDPSGRVAAESDHFLLRPHQSRHLEVREILSLPEDSRFLGSLRIYSRPRGGRGGGAGLRDMGIQACDVDWYGDDYRAPASCHVMRDFVRAARRSGKEPRTRGLFTKVSVDRGTTSRIALQNLSLPPREAAAHPLILLFNSGGETLEARPPSIPPAGSAVLDMEKLFPGAASHLGGKPGFVKILDAGAPLGAIGIAAARDGSWLQGDHSFDEDFLCRGFGAAFVPLVEERQGAILHLVNPYDGAQMVRIQLLSRDGKIAAERTIDRNLAPGTSRMVDLMDLLPPQGRRGFQGSALVQARALSGGRTIGLQCITAEYPGSPSRPLIHSIYPPRDSRSDPGDTLEADLVQERVLVRGSLDTRICIQHASPARGGTRPLVILAGPSGRRISRQLPEPVHPRGSSVIAVKKLFPGAEDLLEDGFGSISIRDDPGGPRVPLVAYLQIVDTTRGDAPLFTSHLIDRDYDFPYG